MEEQQTLALGNLAREGDYVQFFVLRKRASKNKPSPANYSHHMRKAVTLGAVPSTIDDIPAPIEPSDGGLQEEKAMNVRHGHFGCVSESGIFFEHKAKPGQFHVPEFKTKIDFPYSYIYKQIALVEDGKPGAKIATKEKVVRNRRPEHDKSISKSSNDENIFDSGFSDDGGTKYSKTD